MSVPGIIGTFSILSSPTSLEPGLQCLIENVCTGRDLGNILPKSTHFTDEELGVKEVRYSLMARKLLAISSHFLPKVLPSHRQTGFFAGSTNSQKKSFLLCLSSTLCMILRCFMLFGVIVTLVLCGHKNRSVIRSQAQG